MQQVSGIRLATVSKIQRRLHTGILQLLARMPAYSPYISYRHGGQCLTAFFFAVDDTHAVITGIMFRIIGGYLAQCFGGCYAKRHGNAYALQNLLTDSAAHIYHLFVRIHVRQVKKSLVNGVLLQIVGVIAKDVHDTRTQIAVQCKVRREVYYPVLLHLLLYLIERHAHLYTETLHLVAAGYHTTVVTR